MRKVWGAAAAALVMVGASACGGPSGGFALDGVTLKSLDKNLSDIEKSWRADLDGGSQKPRYGNDARCYAHELRIGNDKESVLDHDVLCGPLRLAGSDDTQWSKIPVRVTSSDGGDSGQMVRDGEPSTVTRPSGTYRRADGKHPDLNAAVDEPDLQAAKPGDVVDLSASSTASPSTASPSASSGSWSKEQTLATPEGSFVVRVSSADRAGSGADRRKAPDGGSFFLFSVRPASSSSSSSSSGWGSSSNRYPDSSGKTSDSATVGTWAVKLKDHSFPVTGVTPSKSAAVAIDGPASDAVLEYTYAGAAQQVTASGDRQAGQASGLYVDLSHSTAALDNPTQGDGKTGLEVKISLDSNNAYVSGYDMGLGWPAEGKVWLAVTSSPSINTIRFYKPGGASYEYTSYGDDRQLLDGGDWKCGDTPAKKVSLDSSSSYSGKLVVYCEVPAKADDYKITGNLKAHGKKSQSNDDSWSAGTQDATVAVSGSAHVR